jgi:hypothetical protein
MKPEHVDRLLRLRTGLICAIEKSDHWLKRTTAIMERVRQKQLVRTRELAILERKLKDFNIDPANPPKQTYDPGI